MEVETEEGDVEAAVGAVVAMVGKQAGDAVVGEVATVEAKLEGEAKTEVVDQAVQVVMVEVLRVEVRVVVVKAGRAVSMVRGAAASTDTERESLSERIKASAADSSANHRCSQALGRCLGSPHPARPSRCAA